METAGIRIRQATDEDVETVSSVLKEAAHWLEQSGMPLWRDHELEPERIAAEVHAGLFFLAEAFGKSAGTLKFQLDDPIVWPDATPPDATYVHRLAVRRQYAGTGLSTALLSWAVNRTRSLGRRYVRLDCVATLPRLRAVYERFGFHYHSEKQFGPYLVSRYQYDVTEEHSALLNY